MVEDENDNAPHISSSNSALLLPGTPKGKNEKGREKVDYFNDWILLIDSVLLTVKALDLDSSSNGKVTYRWGGEGSPDFRDPFVLDPFTGQVSLSRNVDSPDHVRKKPKPIKSPTLKRSLFFSRT